MRHRKILRWMFLVTLALTAGYQTYSAAEWQRPLQPSLSGGELVCLAAHPREGNGFFVANSFQLFEGADGSGWKPVWSSGGECTRIRKIVTFPYLPDQVFILTSDKILMGQGGSWKTIYWSGNDPKKSPLSFAADPSDPNRLFTGTAKGLWISGNTGKTWSRSHLVSASNPVTVLRFSGERLLIGDEDSLSLSVRGASARTVFDLPRKEAGIPEEAENRDNGSVPYACRIFDLIEPPDKAGHFFIGTEHGVFETIDGAHNWHPLSQSGLQSTRVVSLAYAGKTDALFAATPHGIYRYRPAKEVWEALSEGLARSGAKSLAITGNSRLIAITGDGFMEYPIAPETAPPALLYIPSPETLEMFQTLVRLEPSARDIQKAVIRFANVANGKIKRWQIASRAAGLLPSLSIGKSRDYDASISTYSGKFITGPDDVSKSWDTDVRWDLGDILYSSDQTSIDSREKMMVELRQDLLSEATRIYYERRRLQVDLVYTPSLSGQEHLERLIRLDELAALLDGMTDGFLSKQLEKIYARNAELNKLWEYDQYEMRGTAHGEIQTQGKEK